MATSDMIVVNGLARGGAEEGRVSIVVSCCGQLEYTRLCVPALLRHSRHPFEMVFLDHDSLDGTAEYLDGVAAAASVRIDIVRVAAEAAAGLGRREEIVSLRGDFVALVNNDVIVPQGWLERLLSLLCSAPDLGMVAPLSSGWPGPLCAVVPYEIHAGLPEEDDPPLAAPARVSPFPEIDKVNRFAQKWFEDNRGQWSEMDSLPAGCVLLKRPVLHKLGLFPSRTPLGAFDTETLSRRVRAAGFRLGACREVFVHDFQSRRRIINDE